MPRSSPSTSPVRPNAPSVEVVELDRDPGPYFVPPSSSGPSRWAILFGIIVVALLGLSLLPTAEIEPISGDATLPDPVVATTLIGSRPRRIAFVDNDAFPLRAVGGLDGFVTLTSPVEFKSRWWMIGNRPGPTSAAVVLSSDHGRMWEEVASIETRLIPEESIRIDQMTVIDNALVAVGSQGTWVGPSFLSLIAGNVALWRSGDGVTWVSELVHQSEDHIAFASTNLVSSGRTILVQAIAVSTTAAEAAQRLPTNVLPPLETGLFTAFPHGFRLVVHGPLGIEVAAVPLTSVNLGSSVRVFRSDSFTDWSEVDLGFKPAGGIVAAPEGGFIANGFGIAFTSAYGTSWRPNTRIDPGFYQQWDGGLLAAFGPAIDLISTEGTVSVQLPPEMASCFIAGSNEFLAAACPTFRTIRVPHVVQWEGKELGLGALDGLELMDPTTSLVRQFPIAGSRGKYDLESDTIALSDTEGNNEAFPVDVLAQLQRFSSSFRHDVLLSRDGLSWSPGQIALWSYELTTLGGIEDGFLFASRSDEPGATLIVSSGDL